MMKDSRNNLFSIAIIAGVMLCFFFRPIFLGETISRVGLLAEYDALYNPSIKNAVFSCQYDPSLYQLQAPVTYELDTLRKNGNIIPLWNHKNGCGYPMIGDPQSFLFSPVRFLFPTTNLYLYNLGIAFRIFLTATGMFFLARALGFLPWISLLCGLSFALSPWQLTYLELPFEFWLYPFVFWTFTRLGQEPSIRKGLYSALPCALYMFVMHPECSFFSIVLASIWSLILAWQNNRLVKGLLALSTCAIATFCLSAPMLLPFAEYYFHSDCYKSDSLHLGALPFKWYAPFVNLIFPIQSFESPFLGIVVAVLLPFSLLASLRKLAPILGLLFLSFFTIAQLPPLSFLFQVSPFNKLMPVYCLPVFMIMILLASALGAQAIYSKYSRQNLVLLLVACIVIVPLAKFTSLLPETRWAPLLTPIKYDGQEWLFCLMALIAMILFSLIYFFQRNRGKREILACILVLLNTATLLKPAFSAVPTRPQFQYSNFPIISFLKEKNKNNERITATGLHTFLANTNQIYSLSDFRLYNPFFPERYLDYFHAAGANQYDLYLHCLQNPLNKLLDMAGVRYLISRFPPFGQDDRNLPFNKQPISPEFDITGINLLDTKINYFPAREAVLGLLKWKIQDPVSKYFGAQFVLTDDNNKTLWISEALLLDSKGYDGHQQEMVLAVNVPRHISEGTRLKVKLLVRENKIADAKIRSCIDLFSFQKRSATTQENVLNNFVVLFEDINGIRLYENLKALPKAYIVHQAMAVKNKEEALSLLKSDKIDCQKQIVIESENPIFNDNVSLDPPLVVQKQDKLEIRFSALADGYMVITQTYYPGWVAKLNGKETPVLRANYLFSCVKFQKNEKGETQILTLEFKPVTYTLGVTLFLLCITAIFVTASTARLPLSNKTCNK